VFCGHVSQLFLTKMIALRVILNGKPICTAGAEDLAVLNAIVSAVGNLGALTKRNRNEPPDIYLSVGGLTGRREGSDEHVRWAEQQPLRAGDRVEIEVIDTFDVDRPAVTRPLDVQRERQKERERYEHAKEVYESLRHKYESERT
jgi:hypothetical protein